MKSEIFKSLVVSFFTIASLCLIMECRPRYIECSNSLECGLGSCCVLGNARFSLPRCVPMGQLNDMCRPGQLPRNVTVNYLDGASVDLSHVYSTLCPCQEGLHCSDHDGICIDQMEELVLNTI